MIVCIKIYLTFSESIPYDNQELQVRAAMEELIDEEILTHKVLRGEDELKPSAIDNRDTTVKPDTTLPAKVPLQNLRSKDSSPSDDNVEEDFELISAEDLSLSEDA